MYRKYYFFCIDERKEDAPIKIIRYRQTQIILKRTECDRISTPHN